MVLSPDTAFLVIQDLARLDLCDSMRVFLLDNIHQLKIINNEKDQQISKQKAISTAHQTISANQKAQIFDLQKGTQSLQRKLTAQIRINRILKISIPVVAVATFLITN